MRTMPGVVPERHEPQVRGGEAVDQVQENGLGVRVGRVRSDRVEHGVAERTDLVFLVRVLDCQGSCHHGIHETVVVRQGLKIEITYPLAEFLDCLSQLGEPLLPQLLQPPVEGSDEGNGQGVPG
jgi:hypothetical protein